MESRNDFTNEYLSRELPAEEEALRDLVVIGANQKRRRVNVWRCSEQFVRRFLCSEERARLNYRLYVRHDGGTPHEVSRLAFRRAPGRALAARAKSIKRSKSDTPF